MRNSFIIHWDAGESEYYTCYCCMSRISVDSDIATDSTIPTFYSYRHAEEKGWKLTKDIRYCPPTETLGVWVCPDCLKEVIEFDT